MTKRDFNDIKNILLDEIMISCEILLFILICVIFGIKIHHRWDRSFNKLGIDLYHIVCFYEDLQKIGTSPVNKIQNKQTTDNLLYIC